MGRLILVCSSLEQHDDPMGRERGESANNGRLSQGERLWRAAGRVPPIGWALLIGVENLLSGWTYWLTHPLQALATTVSMMLFALLGGIYLRSGRGRRMGALFISGAATKALAPVLSYDTSIAPALGWFCGLWFCWFLVSGALLSEREHFGSGWEKGWVVGGGAILIGQWVLTMAYPPALLGLSPDTAWVDIGVDETRARYLDLVINIGSACLMISFILLIARNYGRRGAGLGMVGLTLGSLIVLFAMATVYLVGVGSGLDQVMQSQMLQSVLGAGLAVVLSGSGAWQRWCEVVVFDRVARACAGADLNGIERVVSAQAGSDQVRFQVWLPSTQRFVDSSGELREHVWPPQSCSVEDPVDVLIVDVPGGRDPVPLAAVWRWPSKVADDAVPQAAVDGARSSLRAVQADLDAQEVVRAALGRVLAAQETGRRQVARDLHDRVQQRLLALAMDLGRADARPEQDLRQSVAMGRAQLADIVEEIRSISRGVHPPMLVQYGLAGALEEVAEQLGMQVSLEIELGRTDPGTELVVFSALCEALTNCRKHAAAERVRVHVWTDGERVVGEVVDDGCGGAVVRLGSGLHGVEDRVRAAGGTLRVVSPPGSGTTVRVELPKRR